MVADGRRVPFHGRNLSRGLAVWLALGSVPARKARETEQAGKQQERGWAAGAGRGNKERRETDGKTEERSQGEGCSRQGPDECINALSHKGAA